MNRRTSLAPTSARHPGARRAAPSWRVVAAVALGGAIGAGLRHGFNLVFPATAGAFPLTTFCENVAGACALGFAMVLIIDRVGGGRHLQPFLCTGVLGSFTTFSTFSLESLQLMQGGRWFAAMGYVWGSVFAGLAAGMVGMIAARRLRGRRAGGS